MKKLVLFLCAVLVPQCAAGECSWQLKLTNEKAGEQHLYKVPQGGYPTTASGEKALLKEFPCMVDPLQAINNRSGQNKRLPKAQLEYRTVRCLLSDDQELTLETKAIGAAGGPKRTALEFNVAGKDQSFNAALAGTCK